ncbi:MAG TPA: pitrilysin family protein [Thermoanaerobaculia bacterium]|nr:pitrilysin family protein [Thermoanaerobaculia bacterium]
MPLAGFCRPSVRPAAAYLIYIALAAIDPGMAAPASSPQAAARLPVEAFELDNGMRFLLVRRPGVPMVAAGWAVRTGSGDEQPGSTGISHLLEHLMFHGSRRIGTRSPDREGDLMARQDDVADRLFDLRRQPASPARDAQIADFQHRLEKLLDDQRPLMVQGELWRLYQDQGAVGINALTDYDYTVYYGQIPANKLSLWFWLESDRLRDPVFREFYTEGRVVEEERRKRLESTPEGKAVEQLAATFWDGHPYAWPTLGRTEDLSGIRRAQAEAWFLARYRPDQITAALVGDFDPEQVKALARSYFGRLPRPATPPPALASSPAPAQTAERRVTETCDCTPQSRVLYRTPAFGHSDTYALDVLAGVLNGRTGRLYRSLVLGQGIAFAAYAQHEPDRRSGLFQVVLESKGEATPEALVGAWDAELDRLRREPVSGRELQKVKNQILTDSWRGLADPLALALRLLTWDARGDWRELDRWPEATQAITSADLQRVVSTWLNPQQRTVGILNRGRR